MPQWYTLSVCFPVQSLPGIQIYQLALPFVDRISYYWSLPAAAVVIVHRVTNRSVDIWGAFVIVFDRICDIFGFGCASGDKQDSGLF